jgi:phosphoribosylformylglycinamidine synthase subunit PurS
VIVKPKEAALDPQGNAVRDAMRHLGMPEVRSVRIGKYMEIDVDGKNDDLEKRLHGLCRDLLSNPVIEDYELQKSEVRGRRSASGPEGPTPRREITGHKKTPNSERSSRAGAQRPTPKAFASRQLNAQLLKAKTRRRK